MSEKINHAPEALPRHSETETTKHENAASHEQANKKHEHLEKIDEIRRTAEAQSLKAGELEVDSQEKATDSPRPYVDRQLKTMAYSRLLIRARKQLNPLERPLSRLIHQPIVDNISEAAAKSIGRPSAILGGGIAALVGTAAYYYMAKHYGYEYSYFVFIALLAAGFLSGLLTELLLKTLRRSR